MSTRNPILAVSPPVSRRALVKRLVLLGAGAAGSALASACGGGGPPAMTGADEGGSGGGSPGAGGAGGGGAAGNGAADAGGAGGAPPGSRGADAAAGPGASRPPGALSVGAGDPAVQADAVTYMGGAGPVAAYLARPRAAGDFPGVLVIHQSRGLDDHTRDVARRLAKANFVALAPDLTSRGGTTAMLDPDRAAAFLAGASPADLVADLAAGVAFLGTQRGVRPADRLGVLGFGLGGAYALRLCAANPAITAAVSYYGAAPAPVEMMKSTQAAILAHYAENDAAANGTRSALQAVLTQAGKVFVARVHPGTREAFNDDAGATYNEGAAVAAWSDTLAWLEQFLEG